MVFLTKTTEQYRCNTEHEAEVILQKAKSDGMYTIEKYSSTVKTKKEKGEIVDEWVLLTITKRFNEEKEPNQYVEVEYDVEDAFWQQSDEEE
jgi:hypothetical protein